MTTRRPRAFINRPSEAAVIPFPRLETTPPVTKTYFVTGLHHTAPEAPHPIFRALDRGRTSPHDAGMAGRRRPNKEIRRAVREIERRDGRWFSGPGILGERPDARSRAASVVRCG